jgi:hypothetical protein
VTATILAITALTLFGQAPVRPTFEVASIKPTSDQGLMMVRPLPGRLTVNASLQMLMQQAYGVQAFQIAAGPGWLNSDRFAIEAKADGNATGFTGLSHIQLSFLPDDTAAMPPPPSGAAPALEMKVPSILTALQEQLGLRLEATKGPVEVIVIDHVERPSGD